MTVQDLFTQICFFVVNLNQLSYLRIVISGYAVSTFAGILWAFEGYLHFPNSGGILLLCSAVHGVGMVLYGMVLNGMGCDEWLSGAGWCGGGLRLGRHERAN